MPDLPIERVACPYCGESIELIVDDSAGEQQYIEDCSVCCRPITVTIRLSAVAGIEIYCSTDDETF